MKTMAKFSKKGFAILAAVALVIGSSSVSAEARMEFFKQEKANRPDLKCTTCHSSVPKAADIAAGEKNLNEAGKFYRANKNFPSKK